MAVLFMSASTIVIAASTSQLLQLVYASQQGSIERGQTFKFNRKKDLSDNAGNSNTPQIAVSGNNVYVVWEDSSDGGDYDIFFRRITDGGASFSDQPIPLSDNKVDSRLPQIAVSGNNVYVIWQDRNNGGDYDIFFKRSTDGGDSFSKQPIPLSDNKGSSSNPRIAVIGHIVYVVWQDTSNGGDYDIFFKGSTDGGNMFRFFSDVSSNKLTSWVPSTAVSGNILYVVWEDADISSHDYDILFRRGFPQSIPPPPLVISPP
jgi:hypothetical protein